MKTRGFTLIEVLIVITIIALLSVIIIAFRKSVVEKSKISKTKVELNSLRNAMELFFYDFSDYPPYGSDFCNFPNTCARPAADWILISNALQAYLSQEIEKDPWGNYYYYDKNYVYILWDCPGWSFICSAGPNGVVDSDFPPHPLCGTPGSYIYDDICIFIPDND